MPKEKILLHMKEVILAENHPGIGEVLPRFRRGFYLFPAGATFVAGTVFKAFAAGETGVGVVF